MSAFRNSPPRPRAKQSSPAYPRCLGVSLAVALVACGGAPSEPRGPYDPSRPGPNGYDDPVVVQSVAPNDSTVMVMAVAPEDWDGTAVAAPATTYPEEQPPRPPVRPPPPPYPIEPPDPDPAGGMTVPFHDP